LATASQPEARGHGEGRDYPCRGEGSAGMDLTGLMLEPTVVKAFQWIDTHVDRIVEETIRICEIPAPTFEEGGPGGLREGAVRSAGPPERGHRRSGKCPGQAPGHWERPGDSRRGPPGHGVPQGDRRPGETRRGSALGPGDRGQQRGRGVSPGHGGGPGRRRRPDRRRSLPDLQYGRRRAWRPRA
jgi:hypothetical protein